MSKPVANPYAKQKSNATNGMGAPSTATHRSTDARHAVTTVSATSFSQAFESIEDTNYYRSASERNSGLLNPERVEARSQQRAFETGTTIDEATTLTTDTVTDNNNNNNNNTTAALSHDNMSDRDHHVLLQPHVLYVSTKQRGNGVLSFIRNVPQAFSRMIPDYVMSATRCALFLSCKYHSLYPNYIHRRIAELKTDFTLRILLILVDVEDNANVLLILNKLAVQNNLTLILAWTEEEAARYLETYKAFDGKDASIIQKKEQSHFADQVADFLGTCKGVNKTDSAQLLSQFSNVRALAAASMEEMGLVMGMGGVKVKRLHDALHKPFSRKAASKRKREREQLADSPATSNVEVTKLDVVLEETVRKETATAMVEPTSK
jgi:DNA excision repair protein ERCC-1